MFAGPFSCVSLDSSSDLSSSCVVEGAGKQLKRARKRFKPATNARLPSHVLQTHSTKRAMKIAITAAVGYLGHFPSDVTKATKMKATKSDRRLIRPT